MRLSRPFWTSGGAYRRRLPRGTPNEGGCVHARTIGAALVVATTLAGSAALAQGTAMTNADGTIVACQKSGKSFLRVVQSPSDCLEDERSVTWNVSGPEGPPGATGPAGPPGEAGPAGPPGP